MLPAREGIRRHELATYTGLAFLMLGEFGQAEECFQHLFPVMPEVGNPTWEPIFVSLAKEDPVEFRNRVDLIMRKHEKAVFFQGRRVRVPEVYELPMLLLVRAGFVSEADEILREGGDRFDSPIWGFVRGEIALARGDYATAVDDIRSAIRYRESVPYYTAYFDSNFLGAESLSRALVAQGRIPEAIRALEDTSAMKARTSFPGTLMWGLNWLKIRSRLTELYRATGRTEEARKVEDDLLKHLSYADPGHPIVTRIHEALLLDGKQ